MNVMLSWSSGKDSAWTLHTLRQQGVNVTSLLTTLNSTHDRVAMHAVRRQLLRAQADAASLPLLEVDLPWPCSNEIYEHRMTEACARAKGMGVTHVAFGDLFLADVRQYRVEKLKPTGLEPIFPLWGRPTPALAQEMIAAGLRAVLTCVDPKQIDAKFVGRQFDANLLAELPASCDPCGERGEFHSFVYAGPMFKAPLNVQVGEIVTRDGFTFADVQFQPEAAAKG
ncbi:MAG: adenine nucleotide alpha hydrolase [Planctomycetes bacterium]|nr:adenine nucleotide alpha hydrolase [Planctomycetota bacterium]